MLPNTGLHTRWNHETTPLNIDVTAAATFVATTAWLRVFGNDGANVLTTDYRSNPAVLTDRTGVHLESLAAADAQYTAMLRQAGYSQSEAAIKAAIGPYLTKVHAAESNSDLISLFAAFAVVGAAEFLSSLSGGKTSADIASSLFSSVRSAQALPVLQWDACEAIISVELPALKKASSAAKSSSIDALWLRYLLVAAGNIPPNHHNTSEGLFISAHIVLGIAYFTPYRQLFSGAFVPQLMRSVASQFESCPPWASIRAIVAVAAEVGQHCALTKLPSLASGELGKGGMSASKQPTIVALMLAGLADAGKYQSIPTDTHSTISTNLPQSREAFVAMASRALLEVFTGSIWVAGPMQWGTKSLERTAIADHPLSIRKGNSERDQNEAEFKRPRTESPMTGQSTEQNSVWDMAIRELFPTILSQCGYEWPWPQMEVLLRQALNVDPSAGLASAAPQAEQISKHKASILIGDFLAVMAKEISTTTFPERLEALNVKAGTGHSLKTVCAELSRFDLEASASIDAHSNLVKVQKGPASSAVRVLSTDTLSATRSIYPTPSTLEGPMLAGIHSMLSAIAEPLAIGQSNAADAMYESILNKCDLLPCVIELKTSANKGLATPTLIQTIRHRMALEGLFHVFLRMTQLRHIDHISAILFGKVVGLHVTARRLFAEASGAGVPSAAIAQVIASQREVIPLALFDFSLYLNDGTEGEAQWRIDALTFVQGYTPLSSLMEATFGVRSGFTVAHSGSLVHPSVLALEAFVTKVVLCIIEEELRVPEGNHGSFPPIASASVDLIAWCLSYSRVLGLGTGVGGTNDMAEATFYSRFPTTAKATLTTVSISQYLNPFVVDHPTRGYAIRKVLWAASELFVKALATSSRNVTFHKQVQLEARRFVSSLNTFGLLEWSQFGRAWIARFGDSLR